MKNNKGYTIIESVIAMLLVSVVVGGIFSALMASRRAIIEPSYKEEMFFAVESANNMLKNYITGDMNSIPDDLKDGLCASGGGGASVVSDGEHDISCMLPPVCSTADNASSFTYTISRNDIEVPGVSNKKVSMRTVKFKIMCNREVL